MNMIKCFGKILNNILCVILCCMMSPSIVFSEIPESENIIALVQQADFAFEGRVINIEYRFSERDNSDELPTPYTFVTYEIYKIIKGYYEAPLVTLRFFGGPVNDDEYITTTNQILFDIGDHDLLLVRGNNYLLCPLVNCAQGRFRYINGLVVNELGQTIRIDNDGNIHYGQSVELEDVNSHKMTDSIELQRHHEHVEGEGHDAWVSPDQVDRTFLPDTAGFTASIEQTIIENHSPYELAQMPHFETADSNKPFRDRLMDEVYSRAVEAPKHALAGTPIDQEESIELVIEETLKAAEGLSEEQRKEMILGLAKQYPEFYYDGVQGKEIIRANQVSEAGSREPESRVEKPVSVASIHSSNPSEVSLQNEGPFSGFHFLAIFVFLGSVAGGFLLLQRRS